VIDFTVTDEQRAVGAEARAFLAEHFPPELEEHVYRSGTSHDLDWSAALAERGWIAATWPESAGGSGQSRVQTAPRDDEFYKADAPTIALGTTAMVAQLIHAVGTPEQQHLVEQATRGEIVIVLGFTEPESGSDVAAAQTRAVRDGDEWVVNGSKMFTTNAHVGDYVFLLARTNPEAAKHRGLTTFVVPLDQPGIEVQAVYTLSGERTNIVYFNDVRVADRWRIGDVDGGWKVMLVSLQSEHSASFHHRLDALIDATEEWADEHPALADDGALGEALARTVAEYEVARLLGHRADWLAHHGQSAEVEGPMAKLFSSEALVRATQRMSQALGPDAVRSYFEPTAPINGRVEYLLRYALGTTIYAGTSEVQRGIIATRGLGLPRS